MYVYSGNHRMGLCGEQTEIKDLYNTSLRVGDIVTMFTRDEEGILSGPERHLSVVVSDRYESYSDGTHIEKEGPVEYFVMGIKNCELSDTSRWAVVRVKKFEEVIEGENWTEYKFNYRNE